MGLSHLPAEDVASWVEASCAAQGVPGRVTDALLLRRVVVLLGGGAESVSAQQRRAGAATVAAHSQPPHRLHPVPVQAACSGGAGCDDGVVEQGGDDCVLPIEIESGPLSA
jgi:hypothetical protein